MPNTPTTYDFAVQNEGTIAILFPLTPDADQWIADNILADAMTWGNGIVIEPRYLGPILDGIADDGLTIA